MSQQPRPRLSAEWEPQAGVMLTWPHAGTDWGERLSGVFAVFTEIGLAVAQRESLLSVCCSTAHAADVRSRLLAAGAPAERLCFSRTPTLRFFQILLLNPY